MSSLLTEILISLIVIAIIGGIIGWLIRGVYIGHREQSLESDLKQADEIKENSTAQVKRLEETMRKLNQLRNSEKEALQNRIKELEPLFELVEKRDSRIRELNDEVAEAQNRYQNQLEDLEFDASTKALLGGDDESQVGQLQSELNMANRQKDSALKRYQSQVNQIDDLKNSLIEKDRLIEELNNKIKRTIENRGREQQESLSRVQILEQKLKEKETSAKLTEAAYKQEQVKLEHRLASTDQRLEQARATHQSTEKITNDFLSRENDLKQDLLELRSTLTDKLIVIAKLEKRLETRPTPQSTPIAKVQEFNAENLTLLRGIGPTTSVKLKELGVNTLTQIAELNDEELHRLSNSLPNIRTLAEKNDWIESARKLIESANA